MATIEQCEAAFAELAAMLAGADEAHRKKVDLHRTISARISDLEAVFEGVLKDGQLHGIQLVETAKTEITFSMTSEDLLKLTAGELHFARAWATGKIRVDAGIRDILKLRSLF